MGCCQQRDLGGRRITMDERVEDDRIIEVGVTSSQIKVYFHEKCWDILVLQVTNTTPIKRKEKILWAENPTTIGCLAVMYLAIQGLKNPNKISKELEHILPFVIRSIKKGSDDLRENCLIVLYAYVRIANDSIVLKLLENNIFTVLLQFFMCKKTEMQMMCANICNSIYCGRNNAQAQFLNEGGEISLMNLVKIHSDDKEKLSVLVGFMQNIILDKEEYPQIDMCIKLQKFIDVLKDIRDSWVGTLIFDQINHLLKSIMFF